MNTNSGCCLKCVSFIGGSSDKFTPVTCTNPSCQCHRQPEPTVDGTGVREYQEWCYSVLRLDKDDVIVRETFNHWNDKLIQSIRSTEARMTERFREAVRGLPVYTDAGTKPKDSFGAGYEECKSDILNLSL